MTEFLTVRKIIRRVKQMDKIIELLKKLKALAEGGVDGEKDNAEKLLYTMMKKHGITMDMLEENIRRRKTFKITAAQKKVFFQVAGSVLGKNTAYWHNKKSKAQIKEYDFELTEIEFLEVKAKFDFYWKAYQEELEIFTSAFIHKNRLYSKPTDEDEEPKELTLEEKQRIFKIRQMMDGMESRTFLKQLNQ